MSYADELLDVQEAPDNIFPDFLFNPVFNDFDDGYYQKSFVQNDLMASIKRLRRRYGNYFQWAEAMNIYEEYMETLVEKYGSMRVIKNALHYDLMPDPVPAKPKLKNNKKNRQFMNSGIVPSERIANVHLDSDTVIQMARQMFPDTMGNDIDEAVEFTKVPKETRKRLSRIQTHMEGRQRRHNLYRSQNSNAGTDFIVEYLMNSKRGIYDRHGNYTGDDDMSLKEIVKEQEIIDSTRPELLDDPSESTTVIRNGRLVNRREEQQLEIYKLLYEQGIDVIGAFGNSMSKKSVKMVRSHIGDTEPASKKKLKKIRKRAEKEQEKIARRADNNRLLEETLLGNRFTMSETDNALSFRLKDIYRDE